MVEDNLLLPRLAKGIHFRNQVPRSTGLRVLYHLFYSRIVLSRPLSCERFVDYNV